MLWRERYVAISQACRSRSLTLKSHGRRLISRIQPGLLACWQQLQRLREKLVHHWQRWQNYWQPPSPHNASEAAYLSGIAQVTHAPMPQSSQWLLMTMGGFIFVALLWAGFAEIDIVSSAQGKAIPSSRTKLLQAPQLSMVKAILVNEGDRVTQGQVLVELDGWQSASQLRVTEEKIAHLQARRARIQALLEAIQNQSEPIYPMLDTTPSLLEAKLMQDQWLQYSSELGALEKRVAAKQAAIERLERLLPYSRKKLSRLQQLKKQKLVADAEIEETLESLADRETGLQQAIAEHAQAVQEHQSFSSRFVSTQASELADIERELGGLNEEAIQQRGLSSQYTLIAPFDGTVMEVKAHTRAVVEPAEALLRVVPSNVPLEVEIKILNRDIGFVAPGQEVRVKVDTFTFTKYGAIPGTITQIIQDAVEDERLGMVYTALVELASNHLDVGDRSGQLVPGMTVTADIKVGRRRLIEYVLNPILRYRDESLRER